MTICPLTNKRCDRPDVCNRDMRCIDADEMPAATQPPLRAPDMWKEIGDER